MDDVLGGDGFLLGLVADLVGFGRDEVDELGTAVHHQLPGVVRHSHIRQRLLDHLIDRRSGDREVIVVPGRRSHSRPLGLAEPSSPKHRLARAWKGAERAEAGKEPRAVQLPPGSGWGSLPGAKSPATDQQERFRVPPPQPVLQQPPAPPPPHPSNAAAAAAGNSRAHPVSTAASVSGGHEKPLRGEPAFPRSLPRVEPATVPPPSRSRHPGTRKALARDQQLRLRRAPLPPETIRRDPHNSASGSKQRRGVVEWTPRWWFLTFPLQCSAGTLPLSLSRVFAAI